MDEKKEMAVFTRQLTAEEREAQEDAEMKLEAAEQQQHQAMNDPDWEPGYISRFPFLGFGALALVLVCAIACVITLLLADGVSQSKWPKRIAPNVIVNVLNSIANLAFGIAISNGIAIAWWRKTLQGSTIENLNRSWKFSSSIKEVVLGFKYFNVIALAALTAKLTIIDGALFQSAFNTELRPNAAVVVNITGYANTSIPNTGRVSGRSGQPGLLAKNWNDDLKIWNQGGGLLPNSYEGCNGLCFLRVPGAGFEFDCSEAEEISIDYGKQTQQAAGIASSANCSSDGNLSVSETFTCMAAAEATSVDLFSVSFDVIYDNDAPGEYSYINMTMMYTNATQGTSAQGVCPGTKYSQWCKLRPAVINYPVKIESYNDTHSLTSMSLGIDPNKWSNETFRTFNQTLKQQNYFDVLEYSDISESHLTLTDDTRTRLGGVKQGLELYLGGNASMLFQNVFTLSQAGNAPTYLFNDLGTQTGGAADSGQRCDFQFVNPMEPQTFTNNAAADPAHHYDVPSIVGKINQMMFALALDISNEDDDKDVTAGTLARPAFVYQDAIHYKTDIRYMWGAFASIMFCVLCVLPVYWGYWQLGRQVTLGPFEIAAAFRAPNLYHPSNKPIDALIKEVGDREVKFGAITRGDDAGKIGVAEPDHVARIHPSAKTGFTRRWTQPSKSPSSPAW